MMIRSLTSKQILLHVLVAEREARANYSLRAIAFLDNFRYLREYASLQCFRCRQVIAEKSKESEQVQKS